MIASTGKPPFHVPINVMSPQFFLLFSHGQYSYDARSCNKKKPESSESIYDLTNVNKTNESSSKY